MPTKPRGFHTITLGCKLNQFDSAGIEGELARRGFRAEADPRLRSTIPSFEVLDCVPEWERFLAACEWGTRMVPRFRQKVVEPDPQLAEKLMMGGDKRVILTKRLRLGNGIPLVIERSYLPYGEYKSLLGMKLTGSLYHILTEKFGMELHRSIQTFRAVALSEEDAKLLDLPPKSPGIFLESIIYDPKNIAVEVMHAHHRGDKYVFQVESGQFRYNVKDVKEQG